MSPPKNSPVKFLLVDDRAENLVALEALLRRDGLELLTARSGDEALELLLGHDVALALLDVQMPDMDGFALAELMRGSERTRHVPIIFVTAGLEAQRRVFEGYDAGAVDFLIKPLDPRILRHKTETFFQLYKQRQELLSTLRLNETFVAAVGHDLKNPLNAIAMATELILATSKEPSTRKYAERLKSSGKRMARMIDELFDLARARLGSGIPVERQELDLLPLVRRVVAELETTCPQRTIALKCEGDVRGRWDGDRIAQVVSNLVGNAVRHGSGDAPIDVTLSGGDESISLSVHNAGRIAPDVLPDLFDPFRSSEESRARSEGLGLGLYIVHQIVLAHGGEIAVESTDEGGTTFAVHLPRGEAKALS